MMQVYIVRHGQSEANLSGQYSGWAHVSLTEKGFADAAHAGEVMKGVEFARVYSSDLKRAMQTAQTALPGAELILDPLLREISTGILTGTYHKDALALYGEAHRKCTQARDYSRYGGESHQMHCARVNQFMKKLEEDPIEGNVAIFCHDGTTKAILNYVLGADIHPYRVSTDNGAVGIVCYDNGAWHLKRWNIV
ncbi:MAG: histidine phosphatase family protein [Clostridia bacterium]|nr:histidine phosphatase family protein [Clostridia bacterium]